MFPTSTQKKHWMFTDESELQRLRDEANRKFISKHRNGIEDVEGYFLTSAEERILLKNYELQMRELCNKFNPAMPKAVIGTSFHYFKRFYLHNSVMDYHPKEILVTCVYLACKTEEFNVSISQFVANIRGDRDKASDIILNNELLLMQLLNFHLTIHNPYRPVEGLLIDIKTRSQLAYPERLRPGIDELLEKVFLTDACLLYAPSQLALAAVLHAASKIHENLDAYVTDTLLGPNTHQRLVDLIEAVRKIRSMVKSVEAPARETVKIIEKKLEKCRNQENNPNSQIYKQRMQEILDEDDEKEIDKYKKLIQKHAQADAQTLGLERISSPGN
ncbi:cyclin-H [Nilaparvata lugens]|uniref:cyclin-H n=1 Tax=Nilaparvata lugens TaxID=108931 RepID=UPI000B98B707|nr:cyclin-H [Nilaparvata lugens]